MSKRSISIAKKIIAFDVCVGRHHSNPLAHNQSSINRPKISEPNAFSTSACLGVAVVCDWSVSFHSGSVYFNCRQEKPFPLTNWGNADPRNKWTFYHSVLSFLLLRNSLIAATGKHANGYWLLKGYFLGFCLFFGSSLSMRQSKPARSSRQSASHWITSDVREMENRHSYLLPHRPTTECRADSHTIIQR